MSPAFPIVKLGILLIQYLSKPAVKVVSKKAPEKPSHEEVEEPDSSSVDRLGGWSTL